MTTPYWCAPTGQDLRLGSATFVTALSLARDFSSSDVAVSRENIKRKGLPMPMTTLERDTLAKSFSVSKQLLLDLQPKLASLNELYNSVGGVSSTLTQAELDELPELSGLQKTTVDDALFAMAGLTGGITNAFTALSQMAARFL